LASYIKQNLGGIKIMKKLKSKIFNVFMSALLISMSISGSAFATIKPMEGTDKDAGKHYKVAESHKQITDNYELIKLAIKQRAKGDKVTTFNSKQLLERKVYDDGTSQEDYISSSVAVMDKNGQQINASAVIAATAAGYVYTDGYKSTSNGVGAVAFIQNLYITKRSTPPYNTDSVYRVNSVETKIVNQTGSSYATRIDHGYHIINDLNDYSNSQTVYNPSINASYFVNSIHSGYFASYGSVANSIYSFYTVTTNSGASVSGKNIL